MIALGEITLTAPRTPVYRLRDVGPAVQGRRGRRQQEVRESDPGAETR